MLYIKIMRKNVTKFVWFGEGRYESITPNQTLTIYIFG